MNKVLILLSIIVLALSQPIDHCELIQGKQGPITGPEHMQQITDNIILVASADKIQTNTNPNGPFSFDAQNPKTQGKISLYNIKTNVLETLDLNLDFNFQPFGIYFDEFTNQLFCINDTYEGEGNTVEVFDIDIVDVDTIKVSHSKHLYQNKNIAGLFNGLVYIGNGRLLMTQFSAPVPADGDQELVTLVLDYNTINYTINNENFGSVNLCQFDKLDGNQPLHCQKLPGTGSALNNGMDWDRENTVVVANTVTGQATVYNLTQTELDVSMEKVQIIDTLCATDNILFNKKNKTFTASGLTDPTYLIDFMKMPLEEKREYVYGVDNKKVPSLVGLLTKNPQQQDIYTHSILFSGYNAVSGTSSGIVAGDYVITGSWFDQSITRCPNQAALEEEKEDEQSFSEYLNSFFY